jgi:Nif-specific regulatory protein
MKPRLLTISGTKAGTVQPLSESVLSIGRDDTNQICLIDPTVSRRHCTVQKSGTQYELLDLDSHNGTFVNGIPIHRKLLEHGDSIHIGQLELLYLEREGDPTTSSRLNDPSSSISPHTIRVAPIHSALGVEVGRMARDLAALFRISNVINSIRDPILFQQELLRLIFEVVPAEDGAVVLMDNPHDDPTSVCTLNRKNGPDQPVEVPRELMQRAAWERCAVFTEPGSANGTHIVCLPLIGVERMLGVLCLTASHRSTPFREDHIHFLDSVSRIAAVTLENLLTLDALRSENRVLKEQLHPDTRLIGESHQIAGIESFISRVAPNDSTVLIRGESGTGKEVVARAIHRNSPRADLPFIAINCAAIPDTLLESELFGHERGAFTGATELRKGKLEAAAEGTLFLDEVGELPLPMQAKLLRVLQQREFERLGGTQSIAFKARVLAATNKNLDSAIKSSDFRQDLYYRLNVLSVALPPLREHRDDIPLLALHFAARYASKSKRPFKGISSKARALLMSYSWPGNVRELENAIEHAIVLGVTDEILPEDLPSTLFEEQIATLSGARFHEGLNQTKREMVLNALREANNNYPEAARLLNLHPKYLHRLARNLNIKPQNES